jgi:hypothetical protein
LQGSLRIKEFLFYLCHRSFILSRGMHWVVGELQIIKIYLTTKISCQTGHIRPLSQILETLSGHVRAPGQTCPTPLPYPSSRDLTRACPAPNPDISDLSALSRVNQAYPAPRLGSTGISQICPAPSPDMSDLTQFLSD